MVAISIKLEFFPPYNYSAHKSALKMQFRAQKCPQNVIPRESAVFPQAALCPFSILGRTLVKITNRGSSHLLRRTINGSQLRLIFLHLLLPKVRILLVHLRWNSFVSFGLRPHQAFCTPLFPPNNPQKAIKWGSRLRWTCVTKMQKDQSRLTSVNGAP